MTTIEDLRKRLDDLNSQYDMAVYIDSTIRMQAERARLEEQRRSIRDELARLEDTK